MVGGWVFQDLLPGCPDPPTCTVVVDQTFVERGSDLGTPPIPGGGLRMDPAVSVVDSEGMVSCPKGQMMQVVSWSCWEGLGKSADVAVPAKWHR